MSGHKRKERGKKINSVIFPLAESITNMPNDYQKFIGNLIETIQKERLKAALSANQAMILMYWHIGNAIIKQQK